MCGLPSRRIPATTTLRGSARNASILSVDAMRNTLPGTPRRPACPACRDRAPGQQARRTRNIAAHPGRCAMRDTTRPHPRSAAVHHPGGPQAPRSVPSGRGGVAAGVPRPGLPGADRRQRPGVAFLLVTEAGCKRAISDLYRRSKRATDPSSTPPEHQRSMDSSAYLAEHLHEVPVLLVPCIEGRVENAPMLQQAVTWGSILPATWSFMLAARSRGLGTAWTSLHLAYEREAAAVL